MFGMEWTAQEPDDWPERPVRKPVPVSPLNVYGTALAIAGLLIAIWAIHAYLPYLTFRHSLM
jgi:hypothetical protein